MQGQGKQLKEFFPHEILKCVLGAVGDLALRPVPLRDPGGAQGGGEAAVCGTRLPLRADQCRGAAGVGGEGWGAVHIHLGKCLGGRGASRQRPNSRGVC